MITVPMPIVTPRLMLRPIKATDAQIIYNYKKESWAEFLKWMIWVHPPSIEERSVADDVAFCEHFVERFEKRQSIACLALCHEDNKLIGHGGLNQCNWDTLEFNLGFAVRTNETGKGYATEMALALSKYAFDALSAKKIATFHADGNIGSQKVIEKLGFEKEDVLRKHHILTDGSRVDEHHYAIVNKFTLPDLDVRWG